MESVAQVRRIIVQIPLKFLPGFKLTSKALPENLGGALFGDLTPTSELCQDECKIRYDLISY